MGEEGPRLVERVLLIVLLVGGGESEDVVMLSTRSDDLLAIGRTVELEASNRAELDTEDAGFDDPLRAGTPIELNNPGGIKLYVESVELDGVSVIESGGVPADDDVGMLGERVVDTPVISSDVELLVGERVELGIGLVKPNIVSEVEGNERASIHEEDPSSIVELNDTGIGRVDGSCELCIGDD